MWVDMFGRLTLWAVWFSSENCPAGFFLHGPILNSGRSSIKMQLWQFLLLTVLRTIVICLELVMLHISDIVLYAKQPRTVLLHFI